MRRLNRHQRRGDILISDVGCLVILAVLIAVVVLAVVVSA